MPYMEHDTSIRPLKFSLKVFNSMNSYAQHSDGFLQFPNARTSIWDCFHFHVSPEFSSCFYFFFFFCIFSFISRNLCVVWPFSPLFSILHWFPLICCHSDSFLFMCGWICESVGLRCSPSCTPCPLCDFLVVNVPGPPPQKKKMMLGNVIVTIYVLYIGKIYWENPFTWSHFMLYIFENYFEMFFFPTEIVWAFYPPKVKREEIVFKDLIMIPNKGAPPTSTFIV